MTFLTENKSEIEAQDAEYEILYIKGSRVSKVMLSFVAAFGIIFFLFPILLTIISTPKSGFHFSNIFVVMIFWSVAFFFLKLFLWNTVGREIIKLYNHKISYISDYKIYKCNYIEINCDNIVVEMKNDLSFLNPVSQLVIKNNNQKIETSLNSSPVEIAFVCKKINDKYCITDKKNTDDSDFITFEFFNN